MHVLASLKPASLVFRLPQTSTKAKTMPHLKITRFAAQAEAVLTALATHGAGILTTDAEQTLAQWRKGDLTLDN